eukprot:5069230-Amphidinium_carterae.1
MGFRGRGLHNSREVVWNSLMACFVSGKNSLSSVSVTDTNSRLSRMSGLIVCSVTTTVETSIIVAAAVAAQMPYPMTYPTVVNTTTALEQEIHGSANLCEPPAIMIPLCKTNSLAILLGTCKAHVMM